MKYKDKQEAQQHHIEKYRSDGISKGKGLPQSHDYLRVDFAISQVSESSKVLDVGCNSGIISAALQIKKNCFVKAIDIVPELVKKAKKAGVFAEVGEAENLSRFKDKTFDFVVCTEVLEHLFNPIEAIKEAYRVLKDGGNYVVTVPHPESDSANKQADFHHQNFTFELLDDVFHQIFKRGSVAFVNIPYGEIYRQSNNIKEIKPQWIGLVAKK